MGKPNAYTYGARAAVQCGTPDTIRPTRGIRQLALFRFDDRGSLESYWVFKLDKIGKPLRTTTAACSGGKQGIQNYIWSAAKCFPTKRPPASLGTRPLWSWTEPSLTYLCDAA